MVPVRVRIRFHKQGDLRYLGHRDLVRCFERCFRRSGLPLKMSEGFHPKPRMNFPAALAVGIEGLDELMELELSQSWSAQQVQDHLRRECPPGLVLNSVALVPPGTGKPRVRSFRYRLPVPPRHRPGLMAALVRWEQGGTWLVERRNRPQPVDLCKTLEELSFDEDSLQMRLRGDGPVTAGPRDVLAALGLAEVEQEGVWLSRTAVELHA